MVRNTNSHGKLNNRGSAGKVILITIFVLVIASLLGVGAFKFVKDYMNKESENTTAQTTQDLQSDNQPGAESPTTEAVVEKWQEGNVRYKGKVYRYNVNVKTYLFMGIDRNGVVTEAEDYTKGGQSDAMFLLVVDTLDKEVSMISIHRNSMTPIDVYYADGTFNMQSTMQLCLQHAYGDGKRLSCDRTQAAVERMFYNIPISGYIAMNMDGIVAMNDALGGVTVEVLEDLKGSDGNVALKQGETVKLQGDMATLYLRGRDTDVYDSASGRLKRQQQYLINLAAELQAAAAEDEEDRALKAYDAAEPYVVSNVEFADMVSELIGFGFDESRMYTVPGTVQMGDELEEYIIDQEGLYDLIIKVFYEEVTE